MKLQMRSNPPQSQAIGYIDAEAVRRFDLKNSKDWKNIKSISSVDLEYLYVRSAYDNHGSQKRKLLISIHL